MQTLSLGHCWQASTVKRRPQPRRGASRLVSPLHFFAFIAATFRRKSTKAELGRNRESELRKTQNSGLSLRILRSIMHRQTTNPGRRPVVWTISKSRLREFWQTPAYADSEGPLAAWYRHVSKAVWTKSSEVKASFNHVDFVGTCAVFNVGGNKYRLVTRIFYPSHKVFILRVMTHKQYDEESWAEDCGCHEPPPKRKKRQNRRRG